MNVFELFGTIAINNKEANNSLKDTAQKAERTGKQIQEAFKKAGSATIKAGKAVVGGVTAVAGAFTAAVVSSRDYRTEMVKLDTAFTTNGHSAETAKKTYEALQAVLGETDQAVEAANHLAVMCDNEKDLQKWTDICTGVFATFGDSLPIEGLTESANETSKVGVVTGSLADALNWAGISEDEFNLKLRACRTEQERQSLIMDTLYGQYRETAEQYKENAAGVMNANRATEKWNSAMARLGEIGEPILTGVKNWISDMVLTAVPHLETLIGKLANFDETMENDVWPWIQEKASVHLGVELPEWETMKENAATWWESTKTNLASVTQWALQIPDKPHESAEQLAAAVSGWWTSTALPAIKNASKWSLNLFGHPVEDNATIEQHIGEWWKVKGDIVTAACSWTLQLFGMPKEDATAIASTVSTWWNGIVDQVVDACGFMAKFVGIREWTEEDDAALKAWWENVYNKIVQICTGQLPMPELPDADTLVANIQSWWASVKSRLQLSFNITPRVSSYYGATQGYSSGNGVVDAYVNASTVNPDAPWLSGLSGLFSHASGLEEVPHDGYITRVHKGEAILNKVQADQWRGGSGKVEALLSQLVNLMSGGQQVVLDSGVLVGQLAPAMDARLGTMASRKGRGN